MSLSSLEEGSFVIETMLAAHCDDDPQPDIAEHMDGLGVLLPAFAMRTYNNMGVLEEIPEVIRRLNGTSVRRAHSAIIFPYRAWVAPTCSLFKDSTPLGLSE